MSNCVRYVNMISGICVAQTVLPDKDNSSVLVIAFFLTNPQVLVPHKSCIADKVDIRQHGNNVDSRYALSSRVGLLQNECSLSRRR